MKELMGKIKDSFKKDTIIKVAALFFAIILWNYVLSDTNPQRTTTVNNLSINILNQEALTKQQLMVTEGLADIINSTSVKVSVQKNYLDYVSADNVMVDADLSNIKESGTYEIKLSAKTAYGTVTSISPSTLSITVDKVITKEVPITCEYQGTQKDNIYVSTPDISNNIVEVKGPSSILTNINKAICYINYDKLQTSDKEQSEALKLYFIGENNTALDDATVQKYLKANIYSVTAKYKVANKKTVSVDISNSLSYKDKVKTGLEVKSSTVSPETVTIIGAEDKINSIESLKVQPVSVSGLSSDTIKKSTLIVPSGVTVLEGNTVNITITLQAKSTN